MTDASGRAGRASGTDAGDVLDAATELLRELGPEGLSMRRLAQAVGTSYQVVYSRVGGKGEVVRALHDRGFAELTGQVAALPRRDRAVDRLHDVAAAYLRHALDDPVRFEVMFGRPVADFERDDAARRVEWESFRACWVAPVAHWLAEHGLSSATADAVPLAYRVWTGVHGLTVVHLAGHDSPSGDVRQEVADAVEAHLAAHRRG